MKALFQNSIGFIFTVHSYLLHSKGVEAEANYSPRTRSSAPWESAAAADQHGPAGLPQPSLSRPPQVGEEGLRVQPHGCRLVRAGKPAVAVFARSVCCCVLVGLLECGDGV